MATNIDMRHVAREYPVQHVHFLRKRINFDDKFITGGVPFAAALPAGSQILACHVSTITGFNGGSGNTISVGVNGSAYSDIVSSVDVSASVAGTVQVFSGGPIQYYDLDAMPYIKFAYGSTAPTAGAVDIIITYIPDNDD